MYSKRFQPYVRVLLSFPRLICFFSHFLKGLSSVSFTFPGLRITRITHGPRHPFGTQTSCHSLVPLLPVPPVFPPLSPLPSSTSRKILYHSCYTITPLYDFISIIVDEGLNTDNLVKKYILRINVTFETHTT